MPDELQVLLDERAVERALIALARAMDDRDWATVADLVDDDALGDFGTGILRGRAAIVDLIRGYLDACGPTQHLLGNVVIDVTVDVAVSRAYIRDVHLNSGADPATRFYTLGDYRDRWRRDSAGRWRLTERIKMNRAHVGPLEIFAN